MSHKKLEGILLDRVFFLLFSLLFYSFLVTICRSGSGFYLDMGTKIKFIFFSLYKYFFCNLQITHTHIHTYIHIYIYIYGIRKLQRKIIVQLKKYGFNFNIYVYFYFFFSQKHFFKFLLLILILLFCFSLVQPYQHPVRTNQIPRQVPEQMWYMNPILG